MWCTHSRSTTAEGETGIRPRALETSHRPRDTCHPSFVRRSNSRYQTPDDTRPRAPPPWAATGRSGRPGPCGPNAALARFPAQPAFPDALAGRWLACRGSYPERALKFDSCREPFLQPEVRYLPLLFHCFTQFHIVVIAQTSSQNLEHLRRRLSGCTHDEYATKALFVFPIAVGQSPLDVFTRRRYTLLLLRR